MTRRALVLGGGGTIGVAWLTGLAVGLAERGISLADADLFVGTSAGSVVCTQLALGLDPQMLLALQLHTQDAAAPDSSQFDAAARQAVLARWSAAPEMTPEVISDICRLALAARTMPEEAWLAVFAMVPEDLPWPAKDLLITAVDVNTGEFKVWDRAAGVPLHRAIASSCTVPGLLPPVTINGGRYIDGGVRSVTNADLAAGYDRVLIFAPLGHEPGSRGARVLQAEMAELCSQGAEVRLYHPDREALAAFGPDLMDLGRRAGAAQAGVCQGRGMAAELTGFWG